jgi:iron complex transport system substrate-binding protein
MKKKLQILTGLIVLIMLMSICLVGCSSTEPTEEPPTEPPTEPTAEPTQASESEKEVVEMPTQDMAEREMTLPEDIQTIFSVNSTGTILLYTLAPETMIGWNYTLTDESKAYIKEPYATLPDMGALIGNKQTTNKEELVALAPDLLLYMDTISESTIEAANALEVELGIPVVMLDATISKLPEAYQLLGAILGKSDEAEVLGSYCEKTLMGVKQITESMTDDQKVSVYYASGDNGLQTSPAKAKTTQLIDFVGGMNCAKVEMEKSVSRYQVSLEQVMTWNPSVIIASAGSHKVGLAQTIKSDEKWKSITAVNEGAVYEVPLEPFNWFETPTSVNRVIGLKWTQAILYPELVDYDIAEEAKVFYQLFYGIELTEEDLTAIMP